MRQPPSTLAHLALLLPIFTACTSPSATADAADAADVQRDSIDAASYQAPDIVPQPGLLDPTTIPRFTTPLFVPPAMPAIASDGGTIVEYRIAARQFRQQILPPPFPSTTVWGYGRDGDPLPGSGSASTYHSPGATIETRRNETVRVTWVNGLVDETGRYLPHLFDVDSTLHWADPGGAGAIATPYIGPVPLVTHVHGAHVFDHSDGNPDAWYLPNAIDIPAGFRTRGPVYQSRGDAGLGAATFEYTNDQRAATLWYHDHAMGITRLNAYAGLAGFWIIRDDIDDGPNLPGPAPRAGDVSSTRYFEVPIAIQDRHFFRDGSLAYPTSRAQFDGFAGPYAPESNVPPIWNPEVFGNVMVVNGVAWPFFEVEPRLYRFRVLNGCGARVLRLALDRADMSIVQIGSDGGLLANAPVRASDILLAPAQRADLLIDFSGRSAGENVTLVNTGPDEAYRGPGTQPPQSPADPQTTGQVMQFRVVERTTQGRAGSIPTTLPAIPMPTTSRPTRDVILTEQSVQQGPYTFPYMSLLGTAALGGLMWNDPATEVVHVGDTEIWRIANLTEDAHPVHLHLVQFRVLDRQRFESEDFAAVFADYQHGILPQPSFDGFISDVHVPLLPSESGTQDTVIAYPGTITTIVATFDRAGRYVWHCHVLEHEDNEMMRPLIVTP